VLELVRALDVSGLADRDVLDYPVGLEHRSLADRAVAPPSRIVHRVGHRLEGREEVRVVATASPEARVGADHVLEGRHGAAARLVHEVEFDAEFLALAFHYYAVTEFGVVRDVDLVV